MNLNSPLFLMFNYKSHASRTDKFCHFDNEKLYKHHLKKFGPTWEYAKKDIVYKTNTLSYRTKNLSSFKKKDFILVLGCSHTFGVGLSEEDIYHSHIGRKTNLEILNGGYGAFGPDMVMLNSFLFLKNSKLRPKAAIIQWPELNRFTFKGNNEIISLLPHTFSKDLEKQDDIFRKIFGHLLISKNSKVSKFYRSWLDNDNSVNQSIIFIELTRFLWKLYDVDYFDFTFVSPEDIPDTIKLKSFNHLIKDYARDQNHYGSKTHKAVSSEIYKKIKNNLVI